MTGDGDHPLTEDAPAVLAEAAAQVEERSAARSGARPDAPGGGRSARPDPAVTHEGLDAARHHIDAAWHSADAGTEIPDAARLRQVKRAVMVGLRPVTSHQVPFNRDLTIAVDRLTNVVAELVEHEEVADERLAAVVRRVQAGIATVEVESAELEDEVGRLAARLEATAARVEALEEETRRLRSKLGSALAGDSGGPLTLPHRTGDPSLLRRIGAVGRPGADTLRRWARAVAGPVAEAGRAAPVLDLVSDRGEWLDVWAETQVSATGVDDDEVMVDALVARGHTAITADPLAHLASAPPASLGAVTAAVLADVVPVGTLVAALDAAAAALRPGGLLVLAAADPVSIAAGDPQWADPRRRPLHPRTLTALLLDRGWAEAEVVPFEEPPGELAPDAARGYAVLARSAGGATEAGG